MNQALVQAWWRRIRPWADLIALGTAIIVVLAVTNRSALGVAGLGVVAGSSVAVQAICLVFLYRATRIINFAQVAYGIWAGVWFYQLVGHLQFLVLLHGVCAGCVPGIPAGDAGSLWNLQNHPRVILEGLVRHHATWLVTANFWLSAVVSLWIGAGAAIQLHTWTAKYWQKVPRLVPTVATLGWGTVLVVSASVLATWRQGNLDWDCFGLCSLHLHPLLGWWPYDDTKGIQGVFLVPWREASFTLPFDTSNAHFNTQDILYVTLAVLAALGITALLRFTRTGVYLRGIADNQERAETLGVDVNRSLFWVWAIGGLLSTLVVMIQVTGGPPNSAAQLGAGTLTQMLVITVFARMSSIPLVLAAAFGLGIIDSGLFWNTHSHALYFLVQIAIVGVALMLQRRKLTRAELESAVAWLSSPEIRPTPARLRQLPLVRTWLTWAPVAGITLLLVLPFFLEAGQVTLMTVILSYTIIGISVFILTGWAGQISLGQFGFAALGGFVAVILYSKYSVPLPLAALAAMLASAVCATAVGFPALRLPGPYLAVVSLAVAVAVAELLVSPRSPSLGVNLPTRLDRPLLLGLDTNDERVFYYCALTLLALTVAVVAGLRGSRMRRALIAARDNEPAAQAFGINVSMARLEAFAASGVIAALGGVLLAFEERGVRTNGFDPAIGITIFLLVVIGGAGSLAGPLVGSIYSAIFTLPGAGFATVATGGGVLSVLRFAPSGLGGLMFKARDAILRRMAIRNRISAPSLLADLTSTSSGVLRAQIAPWLRRDGSEVLVETQFELVGGGPGPVAGTFLSANGTDPGPGRGPSSAEVVLVSDGDGSEELLECRQVGVHYDAVQALFNVDFSARVGEIVALVGTNGAGKTTLLRAIAGLHHAARGAIAFDGEDITGRAPHLVSRLGVAMVPGGAGVFPSLSVAENLRAAGWQAGASAGPGLDRVLDYFPRLRERLDAAAGNLSGGEQQILALAQAFLVKPRLLLIDELSIGLAAGVVDTILGVLRQLRDEGAAIVIVEQSLSRSTAIADRAVVLEKGEVRYSGPARELLEHPELFQAISFGAGGVGIGGSSEVTRRKRNLGDVEQTALEVSGISASYGGVAAVRNVSFQLSAGEIVGLIGPNGAGKTTLFDVITGFHPADAGGVALSGVDVTRLQPYARANLGLMRSFQNVRLFPSLTVRDNIAAALERHVKWKESVFHGLWLPMGRRAEAKAQARVDMLVELLGLGAQVDRTMAEIPIGTRRIVDIACQLAARPRVLLLDEPSSGLAQMETEQLGPIITRIARDLDAGILVIEHDIPLVSSIANRLIALDLGEVIAEGAPAVVLADERVRSSYFGGRTAPLQPEAPGRLEPVAATV